MRLRDLFFDSNVSNRNEMVSCALGALALTWAAVLVGILTFNIAAVLAPSPDTWGMLAAGFWACIFLWRRRFHRTIAFSIGLLTGTMFAFMAYAYFRMAAQHMISIVTLMVAIQWGTLRLYSVGPQKPPSRLLPRH